MSEAILPPKPDDLALAFAAALLSSGKYESDPSAAAYAAWTIVPEFYKARIWYVENIAPLHFTPVEPPQDGM